MKMEQWIRAIAGTFILVSVGLGWFYSKYWLFFTAFVGLNLLQSAFTKWCLMEEILDKLGVAKKLREWFPEDPFRRAASLWRVAGNEDIDWHGVGAPQSPWFVFTALTDFEKKKKMARKLMSMKDDDSPAAAPAEK